MTNNLFGEQLRESRARRKWSQLDLALEANITQRHLSFLETGRSVPSRDMVIRLSEVLDLPLRERNRLLHNAGYAPMYLARSLDDPSLAQARAALDRFLVAHEPFPALAVDRHWNMVAKNSGIDFLLSSVRDGNLLKAPVNVLRLALHPDGLAPAIANLPQWRAHLLDRLRHQAKATSDPDLAALLKELEHLPCEAPAEASEELDEILVPIHLTLPVGDVAFFSTTMVFGAPSDITLSELAIEAFYPMDARTAELLTGASGGP